MGKAALDLPDPLQAPPEGAKTSTDELLAQLAGDEIDRLLAEVDSGQPPVSRAPFHVGPPVGPEKELKADAAAPAPPAAAELPKPGPVEMDVAAEMDALFSAATAKDEAAAAEAKAAVAAAAAEAEAETTAAERDGLKAPVTLAPAQQPAAAADDDAPLPIYLRPLEWLNAPLALLPESVRDIVGKFAIVTLLNAAAILVYVLVVRRGQ